MGHPPVGPAAGRQQREGPAARFHLAPGRTAARHPETVQRGARRSSESQRRRASRSAEGDRDGDRRHAAPSGGTGALPGPPDPIPADHHAFRRHEGSRGRRRREGRQRRRVSAHRGLVEAVGVAWREGTTLQSAGRFDRRYPRDCGSRAADGDLVESARRKAAGWIRRAALDAGQDATRDGPHERSRFDRVRGVRESVSGIV